MERGERVRCPRCGALNYSTDPVCLSCGAELIPPAPPQRTEPEQEQEEPEPLPPILQPGAPEPEPELPRFDGVYVRYIQREWSLFLLLWLVVPIFGWFFVPPFYYWLGAWGVRSCETASGRLAAELVLETATRWIICGLILAGLVNFASLVALFRLRSSAPL